MEQDFRLTPNVVEAIRNGKMPPPILLEVVDQKIFLVSTSLDDAKIEAVEVIKDEVVKNMKSWFGPFQKNIAYRLYCWNPYLMNDTMEAWTPFYRGFCDVTDSAPHHVRVCFQLDDKPHIHSVPVFNESEYVKAAEFSISLRAALQDWKPGKMVDYEIYATYDEKGDTVDEWILYYKGSFRLNPMELPAEVKKIKDATEREQKLRENKDFIQGHWGQYL